MTILTMGDKNYQIADTTEIYASSVVAKTRCAIRIPFAAVTSTHLAALKALRQAGRNDRDCDHAVHLRVTCEQCQRSLAADGIGRMIMAQGMHVTSPGGGQGDRCPACKHTHGYLIYDPDGFAGPKTDVAYYLCYPALPGARKAFELLRARLGAQPGGMPFHGQVELRVDRAGMAQGLYFPYWLVIHAKDVDDPNKILGRFFDALDLSLSSFDFGDHDERFGAKQIADNNGSTEVLGTAAF